MPKHTMHCSPDLVTVLPRWFICSLLLCCWLVGPPPGSAPLCAWLLGVHGLLEDNLYKPNSSENKRSEITTQCTVAVLSPLNVLL